MSLRSKVVEGIKWRGIVDVSQQLLQIVFTIILARLLTKADFGIVAMALLVNRFVVTVTNIGFGTAIVQSQTITKAQISAIFYIQFALNLFLTIGVYFGAGLAASFFKEAELIPIIQALAVIIFLQTFQFPNIILRKKMEFKSYSIAEMIAMISSNCIAITLAFLDYGVWALVWRLLMQNAIFGALSFYYGKWLPSKPQFKGIKPLFQFGFNMLGSKVIYYFSDNLVAILTGKLLGKEVLGIFNIAYNLAIKPSAKIQSILTSVLSTAFPKFQSDIKVYRKNSMNVLRNTSIFFIPFMIMLAATSTNLIVTFYGKKWHDAGNMLLILSFLGIFRGLSHLLRNTIVSKGDSRAVLYERIVEIIFSLPLMYILLPLFEIYGLIIGYLIGGFTGWVYLTMKFDRSIDYSFAVFKSISSSIVNSVVLLILVYSFNFLKFSYSITLVMQLVAGVLIFLVLLWFNNRTELLLIFNFIKTKAIPNRDK